MISERAQTCVDRMRTCWSNGSHCCQHCPHEYSNDYPRQTVERSVMVMHPSHGASKLTWSLVPLPVTASRLYPLLDCWFGMVDDTSGWG